MSILTTTAASAGASSGSAAFIVNILPLIFIFVIFYFLLIRPQQRRVKEHQAMIGAVKKNDQVVTAGGIRGKVTRVDEHDVEVEIAQGVKVKIVKSTLSAVVDPKASPAND